MVIGILFVAGRGCEQLARRGESATASRAWMGGRGKGKKGGGSSLRSLLLTLPKAARTKTPALLRRREEEGAEKLQSGGALPLFFGEKEREKKRERNSYKSISSCQRAGESF